MPFQYFNVLYRGFAISARFILFEGNYLSIRKLRLNYTFLVICSVSCFVLGPQGPELEGD